MTHKNVLADVPVNPMFKDRIFRMIFSNKKELLELYNAFNGTNYEDPESLEINTLENAVYMSMRNDISFLIDARLTLYEHQSTYNPNLPLRYLMYIADLYSNMVRDANLYGSRALFIPTPKFIIFYNGNEMQPDRQELKLSDLFQVPEEEPSLELKAVMLNINKGHNTELMERCRTLWDYAEYVSRVRMYRKSMPLEDAVERTITECIAEGILEEFLKKNREEAIEEGRAEERKGREEAEKGWKEAEKLFSRQNTLIKILAESGRTEDIVRVTEDEKYREQLFLELGI